MCSWPSTAPIPGRWEFDPAHADGDAARRLPALRRFVKKLAAIQANGPAIAIADIAYPNGADPLFLSEVFARLDPAALAGYAGWNTAGNSMGSTVAQACVSLSADSPARKKALRAFLFHRLVEDWGYQHAVRAKIRQDLRQKTGQPEPAATRKARKAAAAWIEAALVPIAASIPGLGLEFRIQAGSLRLPWRRTFEIDFEVGEIS
jgi:hypothetical protein